MTRNEYRKLYYHIFGTTHLRKEFWIKHRDRLVQFPSEVTFDAGNFIEEEGKIFMKQHEAKKITDIAATKNFEYWDNAIDAVCGVPTTALGNCEAATPRVIDPVYPSWSHEFYNEKQGNNPMRIDNTTATAYVTTPKSDDATSRDYLLGRLDAFNGWRDDKINDLRKFFNMDAPERPASAKALIEAITNGKFKLDEKKTARLQDAADEVDMTLEEYTEEYGYSPFYSMIFTDLPKADSKGFAEAVAEYQKQKTITKDAIMVKPPADGLTALQALEAWMPTGKAN